jgi:hypothetical protein
VRYLGCDTHQTVALDAVRRLKTTPIHELERYMRCKDCSQAFKMQQLGWSERLNVQRALHLRRIGGRAGIGAVSTPVVKMGYVDHRIHDASAVRIIRARSELR